MAIDVDCHIGTHTEPEDKVYEERHEDAHSEPSEIPPIREELLLLGLQVDVRQVFPKERL